MLKYPKIQTLYKRDMERPGKPLRIGDWTNPEFAFLADCQWQFTEKVDGTNVRVRLSQEGVQFAGRTDDAQFHPLLLGALTSLFAPDIMRSQDDVLSQSEIILFGEGYGPKVNGGGCYRVDHSFVLFDATVNGRWASRDELQSLSVTFGIDIVPLIGTGTLIDAEAMAREGFQSRWGPFTAEGIVARPVVELQNRYGERIITKIKHRDFRVS